MTRSHESVRGRSFQLPQHLVTHRRSAQLCECTKETAAKLLNSRAIVAPQRWSRASRVPRDLASVGVVMMGSGLFQKHYLKGEGVLGIEAYAMVTAYASLLSCVAGDKFSASKPRGIGIAVKRLLSRLLSGRPDRGMTKEGGLWEFDVALGCVCLCTLRGQKKS